MRSKPSFLVQTQHCTWALGFVVRLFLLWFMSVAIIMIAVRTDWDHDDHLGQQASHFYFFTQSNLALHFAVYSVKFAAVASSCFDSASVKSCLISSFMLVSHAALDNLVPSVVCALSVRLLGL